jgi:hypothetical protein
MRIGAMETGMPRLDKSVVTVAPLARSDDDREYWLKRPPAERMNAIEINRRLVYGEDRTTSRLQRFLEVDELARS